MVNPQKRVYSIVLRIVLASFLFLYASASVFSDSGGELPLSIGLKIYHESRDVHYSGNFDCADDMVPCSQLDAASSPQKSCCSVRYWCDPELGSRGTGQYYYAPYHTGHELATGFTYKNIAAYYIDDFDKPEFRWACDQCAGQWEDLVDTCCGDDPDDDPDMGPEACKWCPIGQFPPDEEEGISYRNYYDLPDSLNKCCGDDLGDCGATIGNQQFICTDIPGERYYEIETRQDPDFGSYSVEVEKVSQGPWRWQDASLAANLGLIMYSPCSDPSAGLSPFASYVSDGSEWIACVPQGYDYPGKRFDISIDGAAEGEVENPLNINGNDFMCYPYLYENQNRIVECCGGDPETDPICYNDQVNPHNGEIIDMAGNYDSLQFGDSIEIAGRTFFCTEDSTFLEDLDDSPDACFYARYPVPNSSKDRGYIWSGSLCCGEPEDFPEYYNDHDEDYLMEGGACFNSTSLSNLGPPMKNFSYVKALDGRLSVCIFNEGNYHDDLEWLKDITDTHTGKSVINNVPYCTVDRYYEYYCDYDGHWKMTPGGLNVSNLVYLPKDWQTSGIPTAGCCEPDTCWNGSECFHNQARYNRPDDRANPIRTGPDDPFTGYRCADGKWIWSTLKKDLEGHSGYCPRNEDCLVKVDGNYEDNGNTTGNPQCIHSGQYIEDNYCQDGEWQSRTKLLALSLISIAGSSDHELYCGPYEDILNYYDYTTENLYLSVLNFFEDPAQTVYDGLPIINNLCLLKTEDNLMIAASMNQFVEYDHAAELFPDFGSCSPQSSSQFSSCSKDPQDRAWINPEKNLILYAKDPIAVPTMDYDSLYQANINPRLTSLKGILKSNKPTSTFSYDFLEDGLRMDYLYSAKKGQQEVFATYDDLNIIASYKNIPEVDACAIIAAYNETHRSENINSRAACSRSGNTYNMILAGSDFLNIKPKQIWSDLTGELRLG